MENQARQNTPQVQLSAQTPIASSKNRIKILLLIISGLIVLVGSIFVGIQIGKNQITNRQPIIEQSTIPPTQTIINPTVLSTTCSNLTQGDCQKLENYQSSGWNINKVKIQPGYENSPNEVVILSKKTTSFIVKYSLIISKEEKKIISRLPEPQIFNNILQEAQKDNLLISLIDTGKLISDVKVIDRKLLPWEEGSVHKGADYFELVAEFSTGEDKYGVECTKSYFIQFTESGEILKHETTESYCPGPL